VRSARPQGPGRQDQLRGNVAGVLVTGSESGPGPGEPDSPAGPPSRRTGRPPGGAGSSLRPLRYRGFALLWGAGLVSTIGSWMQTVAVGALVISQTGKATWAVLVAAGAFLPIGLLSPVGGALADRVPRRPMLVAGNLAAAATAVVLAVLVASGHDHPLALVGLVTVQGAASALIGPFQQAILPDLVPETELLAAISLNSAQFNLGRIAGPALAGATVAAFGYPVAFEANALSFMAVVVALMFVRLPPPAGHAVGLLSSLRSGLSEARAEPSSWAAIRAIAVVALIASPFIALVPVMAHHLTPGSARAVAQTTGLLTSAQGAGAVAGALVLAPLAARLGLGRVLGWSLLLFPVSLMAYATSQTPWWGAATLFIVGLVYIGVLSGLSTVVQLRAPDAYRGRILGFYLVALGVGYPIGSLVQGPIIDQIGVGWTTAGSAAVLLAVMAAIVIWRPHTVRALTSVTGPPPVMPETIPAVTGGEPCPEPQPYPEPRPCPEPHP
jgi:MFS family permease